MLADGFMFSLINLAGLGSIIALIQGLRALRIIRRSNGQLTGTNMAWWCIIAGALGAVLFPLLVFLTLTSYMK